jgi:AraC-like DNA-binding protein
MKQLTELHSLITRHCSGGRLTTVVPRFSMFNVSATTRPGPAFYEPTFCVAVQGQKRLTFGDRVLIYDAARCLIVSVDLPATAEICQASADAPYLAVCLKLDRASIASLLLETAAGDGEDAAAMAVMPVSPELLDPVVRLARLLDRPDDVAVLAPLIERELLYRLLTGPQGPMLRQIALADSRLSRVARAIDWIRKHYQETVRVDDLAAVAGMSQSSFFRHFRAATAMSPLQYQKQIRLQEARHLLIGQSASAGSVAFAVGYDSPSQFSREYARQFGMPPTRDAARLRDLPGGEEDLPQSVAGPG